MRRRIFIIPPALAAIVGLAFLVVNASAHFIISTTPGCQGVLPTQKVVYTEFPAGETISATFSDGFVISTTPTGTAQATWLIVLPSTSDGTSLHGTLNWIENGKPYSYTIPAWTTDCIPATPPVTTTTTTTTVTTTQTVTTPPITTTVTTPAPTPTPSPPKPPKHHPEARCPAAHFGIYSISVPEFVGPSGYAYVTTRGKAKKVHISILGSQWKGKTAPGGNHVFRIPVWPISIWGDHVAPGSPYGPATFEARFKLRCGSVVRRASTTNEDPL